MKRNIFFPLVAAALFIGGLPATDFAQSAAEIRLTKPKSCYQPLEEIELALPGNGTVTILDGQGAAYFQSEAADRVSFRAGGALGNQTILLRDDQDKLLTWKHFCVDGDTHIRDAGGRYEALLQTLYQSMIGEWGREADIIRYNGRFYHFFVRWLRDHVHTLKGMKYFYPELQSGIDLYAETQREDGMIWDNVYPRNQEKNWWDKRFRYGDFIREAENGTLEFKRIPIENDVEYLFIEGLYYTWKATGDDAWMQSHLDKALKAVQYATTDPYRWSEQYQLLKRGFTIDTWDFQSNEDAALVGGDIMVVELDKTRFGVMFGDNTGMAKSLQYLAEMLRHNGRQTEAEEMATLGRQIQERIDELAWNGSFYTHHIPEDPNLQRDLGVDLDSQVSLSNAYSLNRGLTPEQCRPIIQTYQRIRKEMPASSPGEWYTIYPPFEYGFGGGDNSEKWEYMNGGVTSIVAGELARGAFEYGYETYGVNILNRLAGLARQSNDFLHCTYRGAMPDEPERAFTQLSLQSAGTIDYPGQGARFQDKWIGDGHRAGVKEFAGVPFSIVDPEENVNTCLQLGSGVGRRQRQKVTINQTAASIYLLHTTTPGNYSCQFKVRYADGKTHTDYITNEKVGNWWIEHQKRKKNQICAKAWRSDNDQYVSFFVYGWNNPFPDKIIQEIEFIGTADGKLWNILGLTLSGHPVFFMPDLVSHGIPDNWGAAAVVNALVEGLAGVVDRGQAFDRALIAPRWNAAGVSEAEVLIKYPASGGYVCYRYDYEPEQEQIALHITGSGSSKTIRCLIPEDRKVASITKNQTPLDFSVEKIENTNYAVFADTGIGVGQFKILLEKK